MSNEQEHNGDDEISREDRRWRATLGLESELAEYVSWPNEGRRETNETKVLRVLARLQEARAYQAHINQALEDAEDQLMVLEGRMLHHGLIDRTASAQQIRDQVWNTLYDTRQDLRPQPGALADDRDGPPVDRCPWKED